MLLLLLKGFSLKSMQAPSCASPSPQKHPLHRDLGPIVTSFGGWDESGGVKADRATIGKQESSGARRHLVKASSRPWNRYSDERHAGIREPMCQHCPAGLKRSSPTMFPSFYDSFPPLRPLEWILLCRTSPAISLNQIRAQAVISLKPNDHSDSIDLLTTFPWKEAKDNHF